MESNFLGWNGHNFQVCEKSTVNDGFEDKDTSSLKV
jgi:hypothetical protein